MSAFDHSDDHNRDRHSRPYDEGCVTSFPPDLREIILEEVLRVTCEEGWDQPFSITGVCWDGSLEALDSVVSAGEVGFVKVFEGSHPYHDLPGRSLPGIFDAAVLFTEGWDYPDSARALSLEERSLLGPPSELPDRVEVRLFNFVSRRGEEATLFLRYPSREQDPERLFLPHPTGGRVRDVFRRFVGLPLSEPPVAVTEVLGRFWGMRVLEALDGGADLASVLAVDPLSDVHLVTDEDLPPEAREGLALLFAEQFSWEQAYFVAQIGAFPVSFPQFVLDWCDPGLFARMVVEETPSQAECLDRILASGHPVLAIELYQELKSRGWLSTGAPRFDQEPELLLSDSDLCSCHSGREFGRCHGRCRRS